MNLGNKLILGAVCSTLMLAAAGCGGSSNNGTSAFNNRSGVRTLNTLNNGNGGANGVSLTVGSTAISNGTNGLYGQYVPSAGYTNVPSGAFSATATGGGLSSTVNSVGGQSLVAGRR